MSARHMLRRYPLKRGEERTLCGRVARRWKLWLLRCCGQGEKATCKTCRRICPWEAE